METLKRIWQTKTLRNKILIVLGLLLITRIIAHIPLPGVDTTSLKSLFPDSQLLNLFDIFSGGGLTNLSIAMLGVGPYITASIVMQLLTLLIPRLKELQKESGEAGRMKINQYTRLLTIPLAALQGFSTIRLLQSTSNGAIFGTLTPFQWFVIILGIIAGTMLIMWIGELITEYGIGNGVSLIIFAGIVASLPKSINSLISVYNSNNLGLILAYIGVVLLVIIGVVFITEAQRNIPVTYARRGTPGNAGSQNSHLPLRLNQAGVIPIIFAVSFLMFPAIIAQFFTNARTPVIREYAAKIVELFNQNQQDWWYGALYFALVVLFTYFYTTVVFNPQEISENMQRSSGFVPGIRPGQQTAGFLNKIVNRITLPGAVFLGLIAILPFLLQRFTGAQALTIGGTSLLIAVSVVIETVKQIEAQMTMHDYRV